MISELLEVSNRRQWSRVRCQWPCCIGLEQRATTLNLSLRGARLVASQELPAHFPLTLEYQGRVLELQAETVWEESLSAESRVVGVRFLPDAEQQKLLRCWMDLAQHSG